MTEADVFTVLDLNSAYRHIPINEGDEQKTTFLVSNAKYQWRVLPFWFNGYRIFAFKRHVQYS